MPVPLVRSLTAIAVLLAAGACADQNRLPTELAPSTVSFDRTHGALGTTTVNASKTASGFYERRVDYDWSITKRVKDIMDMTPDGGMYALPSVSDVEIPRQQVRWIEYEITANRTPGQTKLVSGVRGQICVTNTGSTPTSGLSIVDVVQVRRSGEHYATVKSVPVPLGDKSVLQPGESHCYPYDILLQPVNGATYRNTAHITITNYQGHTDESYGPCDDDDQSDAATRQSDVKPVAFQIPGAATDGPPMDPDAVIHDGMPVDNMSDRTGPCAEHFYMYWCTTNTSRDEYYLDGPGTVDYIVDLHNLFGCGDSFDLPNEAELVEGGYSGSGTRRTAKASLHIRSDSCEPAPGCVEDAGYWSKVPFWPGDSPSHDFIRNQFEFFDSHRTWQQTVATEDHDTYRSLAREYVAANLNRANQAHMPADIRNVFAATAHYFSLAPGVRALTADQTLQGWHSALAAYNKGLKGVPHCNDDREHGDKHDSDHDKQHDVERGS